MPGPRRFWNAVPDTGDINTKDFLTWVMTSIHNLQGPQQPLPAPPVTTIPQPGAVQICWNEVVDADAYAIFEHDTVTPPPGLPLATVPANVTAFSNSYLRSGINDTTTRYYFVQAMNRVSNNRSTLSAAVPGAALSAASPVSSLSATPVNQETVGGGTGGGGAIAGIFANTTSS